MAAIERKPLTAYQRRLRKELGGDEDDQPTVDQQLARLEVDIRRLKVEFDIFFNGGVKHPPYETRNRVETTFARLGDDRTLTYAQRYKYNSLASRFASFRDMWRRSMQSKEEGRDFITVARAKLTAMREAADAEIAARNAAKYGTTVTNANVAPQATPLVEKPAPELAAPNLVESPIPAIDEGLVIAAPLVAAAPLAPSPPQLELVPPVAVGTEGVSSFDMAKVEPELSVPTESLPPVAEGTEGPPEAFESIAREHYQTDGFGDDPVPVESGDVAPELESNPSSAEPEFCGAPLTEVEAVDQVIPQRADDPQPVNDVEEPLKSTPTRFPKILPPSAHAAEPPAPVKYARRSGDRRSGDRRALPFGRRATDYTPEDLKPNTDAPIIVPKAHAADLAPFEAAESVRPMPDESTSRVEAAASMVDEAPTRSPDQVKSASGPNVPNVEVGSFEFTNPRREPAQVKALVAALVQAKETCGESAADLLPSRYGHLLAARAEKLKKKSGCTTVIFTIVIEDGQVSLNARAGE